MSVESLAVVLHHSRAKGVDKLVLLGVANHAGDGGAWPTVATLARYANATERTVQRSLSHLVELEELVVHKQQGGSHDLNAFHRPNRYDVTVSCPPTCDRSTQHRVTHVSPGGDKAVTRAGDMGDTRPGDTRVTQTVTRTQVDQVSSQPTTQKPVADPKPWADAARERMRSAS